MARIAWLDGLRAIAVILVIAFHLAPAAVPGGFIGVDLFFVISGFIITALLLREIRLTGGIDLGRFWLRRAARLIPGLLLVLVVCLPPALLLGGAALAGAGWQAAGAVTFTANWVELARSRDYFAPAGTGLFGNLWSLGIEEQFYLLWPLLLPPLLVTVRRRGGRATAALVVLAAAGCSVALLAAATAAGMEAAAYYATPTHLVGLLLGCALALAVGPERFARPAEPPARSGARGGRATALTAATAALVGALGVLAAVARPQQPGVQASLVVTASVLGALLILVLGARGRDRVLGSRALRWIGDRSYGLYLWHVPVLVLGEQVLGAAGWSTTPRRLLALGATVVLAAVSHRLVERPARAALLAGSPGRGLRGLAVAAAAAALVCLFAAVVALSPGLFAGSSTHGGVPAAPAAPHRAEEHGPASSSRGDATGGPGTGGTTEPDAAAELAGISATAVGDSVMLASSEALRDVIPGIRVDAVESRQLGAGPDVVQAAQAQGGLGDLLVVGLGTNGVGGAESLNRIVEEAGPDRAVVFVTVHAERSWAAEVNAAIREVAAEHDNVAVADWDAAISVHPELLAPDGIHPGAAGAAIYAGTVADAYAEARR
ncbi:Lipopolysaccharide modification acyltransferase [Mycetocola reblochoni REB411]|uniref:Lipopolysaccharide modification acyltransferase n=1 Tax=Mycetocola reblochoni REB411 TaxID=1255698 RepID=A0A1R4KBX5_9MICO|nr:Lipopolysaccharide modification acyltransferase [Mycetocola reblochoni REB411]